MDTLASPAVIVAMSAIVAVGSANYAGACIADARVLSVDEKAQAAADLAVYAFDDARTELTEWRQFGWFVSDTSLMAKVDRTLGRLSGYAAVHLIEKNDLLIAHIVDPLKRARGIPYDSRVILAVSNCGQAWDRLDLYPKAQGHVQP